MERKVCAFERPVNEVVVEIKEALLEIIKATRKKTDTITFLCIGTDRCIIDSVGPIVGSRINTDLEFVKVIGNLDVTLNALNLKERTQKLKKRKNLVIAIDASISNKENYGTIIIANKPMSPGKGIGKNLGKYGDIGIQVIMGDLSVNFTSDVRLGEVMDLVNPLVIAINELLEEMSIKEVALTSDSSIINDPFTNEENVIARLRNEYLKYGKLIIAYDFDYTLNSYRGEPWKYPEVVQLLKDWKDKAHFICYTASPEERYPEIERETKELGVPLDYINENIPGVNVSSSGKIYYSILLDDRAGLGECVRVLRRLINEINRW